MIKKLRRKFIATAMLAVAIVLAVIMISINVANYINIIQSTDTLLDIIAGNGGSFDGKAPGKMNAHGISPETPFETRYFTVTLSSDGSIISTTTDFIAAIGADDAAKYAEQAFSSGKTRGFIGNYRYKASDTAQGIMYIFIDCGRTLNVFNENILTTLLVSLVGLLCVFALVVIFSRITLKPVEDSYIKQKQFITDASHELKTPLTIIDANTEVLELENGENEWTASTRKQVIRLSSLIASLITLSRMDEGGQKLRMTDFSLSDAVNESLEPFVPVASSQGKEISADIEKNITMNGNEKSIRQLVSLLTDNAVKYADNAKPITVTLKKQGKYLDLKFSNFFPGIGKGSHDILFERFYRADSSRSSETGGYGIGLSVVKSIAEAHRGKVSAYSPDGDSIEFTVRIPSQA